MRWRLYVQARFKNHSVVNNDSQSFRSLVKGKFIFLISEFLKLYLSYLGLVDKLPS